MGLPSMRPTGWFQVAWSADLEVGDVKALHYFGEDLVAFRDLNGVVRVLDAHCRHLGADLSHGGCVVEGGIQCPLHGWVWSGADGRNVRIPYEQCPARGHGGCAAGPPPNSTNASTSGTGSGTRTRSGRCRDMYRELNGPVGRHYFRPIGPGRETVLPRDCGASAIGRREHRRCTALPVRTSCPAQPDRPGRGLERLDVARQVQRSVGRSRRSMVVRRRFELQLRGPRRRNADHFRLPDTRGRQHHRHLRHLLGVRGPRLRRPALAAKRLLPDDIPIWGHQRYLDRPALAPSEAEDFEHLREWSSGFYPPAQPDLRSVTL